MRILGDFTNENAPDGDYLYGAIRDNNGSQNGTPVNEFVYGDIHQLNARISHYSGVASNGLPDNEYNGWQMFEAFTKYLRKYGESYRYVPSGSPLVLTSVDVRRNVNIIVEGVSSGGIIGLPNLADLKMRHLDTVTISNYCGQSVDVDTYASNQYIGGYGTSALSITMATLKALEIILIDDGVVRFWLRNKYFTIA